MLVRPGRRYFPTEERWTMWQLLSSTAHHQSAYHQGGIVTFHDIFWQLICPQGLQNQWIPDSEKTMYNLSWVKQSWLLYPCWNTWPGEVSCLDWDSLLCHLCSGHCGQWHLLHLIVVEDKLYEPMFFFLSLLATTDLILSTATCPNCSVTSGLAPRK